jgi:hypothetical protein
VVRKVRLLGLLLALVLGVSALQAKLPPPPFPCQPGVGICKICGCPRCPVCPLCCIPL